MQFPQDFYQVLNLSCWLPIKPIPFDYSEGSAIESYLTECLNQAADLSSTSLELAGKIRDWPTEYHLSPLRSNLLRPLKLSKEDQVLEIGAGCGAITRFLGETAGSVIAVEGSPIRAEIAARRCRGLSNVTVICSPFQDLSLPQQFSVVTIIGVLEYSAQYIPGENPYHTLLEHAQRFLKPGGILILAIENQLGLKYFAGSPEDHTGKVFDGLEGYMSGSKVRTFGLPQLRTLLDQVGLIHQQYLYPFPDYKMPNTLLSLDQGSPKEVPFFYRWIQTRETSEFRSEGTPLFDPYLVSRSLEANQSLGLLSNSFLVVASASEQGPIEYLDSKILAYQYESQASLGFRWEKKLELSPSGKVHYCQPLVEREEASSSAWMLQKTEPIPWMEGRPLLDGFLEAFKLPPSLMLEGIQKKLEEWQQFLEANTVSDGLVPGDFWDATPVNLIPNTTGFSFHSTFIYSKPLPLRWILARGCWEIYHHEPLAPSLRVLASVNESGFEGFLNFCLGLIAESMHREELIRFYGLEQQFHQQVLHRTLIIPPFLERRSTDFTSNRLEPPLDDWIELIPEMIPVVLKNRLKKIRKLWKTLIRH